jgi:Pentapeptide repeats (8 copies).
MHNLYLFQKKNKLSEAKLSEAKLSEAKLSEAKLSEAKKCYQLSFSTRSSPI